MERYRPVRNATLRYLSKRRICSRVITQLHEVLRRAVMIADTPVVIATIPGICLINYSPAIWYCLKHLQPILDGTITELSHQIRGLNRLNGFCTPNLAYPAHRCRGNGRRYYAHYAHLYDGLHPGESLKVKWARHIVEFCAGFFPHIWHMQDRVPTF